MIYQARFALLTPLPAQSSPNAQSIAQSLLVLPKKPRVKLRCYSPVSLFPIWGVGSSFPGLSSPPADGEEAALPPGSNELNPSVLDVLWSLGEHQGLRRTPTPGMSPVLEMGCWWL